MPPPRGTFRTISDIVAGKVYPQNGAFRTIAACPLRT